MIVKWLNIESSLQCTIPNKVLRWSRTQGLFRSQIPLGLNCESYAYEVVT